MSKTFRTIRSIGASASQQSPDPLLSFDLLSAIDEEPQVLPFLSLLFLKRRVFNSLIVCRS
uniref:Uncharacterized protein n=1 Tax=Salix viminalis TaxID=40686 RepID=A0A6N2MFU9_SALVM